MAATEFALPQSSWPELRKIIHAYFLTDQRSKGDPVSVPDVAQAMSADPTWVSRNNKFLAAIGLIAGGRKKQVSPIARELGLALDHDNGEQIVNALARVVEESDFLSRITDAVRVRGGMDIASLQTHIAITAGAAKTKQSMTGAAAIVQMLLLAESLVDHDGTLRVGTGGRGTPTQPDIASDTAARPPEVGDFVRGGAISSRGTTVGHATASAGTSLDQATHRGQVININLNIDLSRDNVDVVVELLRRLAEEPGQSKE